MLAAPGGVQATYFGSVSGSSTTYYYWVQALYPSGASGLTASAPVTVYTLGASTPVGIQWNPVPGAIAYNVYRTTTSTRPSTGSTAIILNHTSNVVSDIGSPVSTTAIFESLGITYARMRWDFSVDGGAVSTLTPADTTVIPAGSLVVFGNARVSTAGTSGGSATVAVGTSAGSSTTSILGATAVASLTLNAVIVGACNATPFRMSAAGSINVTIGTAAMTAGVLEVVIGYLTPTAP